MATRSPRPMPRPFSAATVSATSARKRAEGQRRRARRGDGDALRRAPTRAVPRVFGPHSWSSSTSDDARAQRRRRQAGPSRLASVSPSSFDDRIDGFDMRRRRRRRCGRARSPSRSARRSRSRGRPRRPAASRSCARPRASAPAMRFSSVMRKRMPSASPTACASRIIVRRERAREREAADVLERRVGERADRIEGQIAPELRSRFRCGCR